MHARMKIHFDNGPPCPRVNSQRERTGVEGKCRYGEGVATERSAFLPGIFSV